MSGHTTVETLSRWKGRIGEKIPSWKGRTWQKLPTWKGRTGEKIPRWKEGIGEKLSRWKGRTGRKIEIITKESKTIHEKVNADEEEVTLYVKNLRNALTLVTKTEQQL